jgi:glutathione S-transferase
MTLYLKAGPDGTSVGDCPFAHYVRLVLETKGLEYEVQPTTPQTKPQWLVEYYQGKMPALRHRKECYVDSNVIVDYLEFFFPEPSLSSSSKDMAEAEAAMDGLFAVMASYFKHTPDGDEVDMEKKRMLESHLATLNAYLSSRPHRHGPFLVGDGSQLQRPDCRLAPILYHLVTGLQTFKKQHSGTLSLEQNYPAVQQHADAVFALPSFQATLYPPETIEWGWNNARNSSAAATQ